MSPEEEFRGVRYVGVGCVTAVGGLFSGGMIGVLIAKVVGSFRGCNPGPELPACDWQVYAGIGMLIGVLTLPVLALSRLRRGDVAARKQREENGWRS
jgi:MFS family permease